MPNRRLPQRRRGNFAGKRRASRSARARRDEVVTTSLSLQAGRPAKSAMTGGGAAYGFSLLSRGAPQGGRLGGRAYFQTPKETFLVPLGKALIAKKGGLGQASSWLPIK